MNCGVVSWFGTKETIQEITRQLGEPVRGIRDRLNRGQPRVPSAPGLHETFEAVREVQAGC